MTVHVSQLTVSIFGAASAATSVRSVLEVLASAGDVAEHLVDVALETLDSSHLGRFVLLHDTCGIICTETIDCAADGAGELHGVGIVPDQRYVELVSAIAADADADLSLSHGWPILSLAASRTILGEEQDVASLSCGESKA